jgi:plasmid stabilization system protein ParE
LGAAFADEILRVTELARLFPGMGAAEMGEVRNLVTKRFPFLIYYEVVNDCLWIWAVMHAAREPGYWKSRKSGFGD